MERRLLKFSESKVKKLTIDYEDQTLGGMRKFEETVLPDGIRRTYTYAVEFTKFIKKPQPSAGAHQRAGSSAISKLYEECKINVIVESNGDVLHKAGEGRRETRGRPRKYPVGEEPYRRKKASAGGSGAPGQSTGGPPAEHVDSRSSAENRDNTNSVENSAFEAPAGVCTGMSEEDAEVKAGNN